MPGKNDYSQDLSDMIDGDPEDGIGPMLEPIRQYLCDLTVTVITMYRGHDAEMFTQVVEGEMTAEQMDEWRKAHFCDQHGDVDEDDDYNNMFFRIIPLHSQATEVTDLLNVDGEEDSTNTTKS